MTVARSPAVLTITKGLLRDGREDSQKESPLVLKLSSKPSDFLYYKLQEQNEF
jgi:DhnA family fructose-bisphosphate aldolase class Ia